MQNIVRILHHQISALVSRDPSTHKGDFGHALLVGGARGMTGAISIAGRSCLRTGAGRVSIAVPMCCWELVAAYDPHYMTLPQAYTEDGTFSESVAKTLLDQTKRFQCLAIGPGLGRNDSTTAFVRQLYMEWQGSVILDADALFALGSIENWETLERRAAIILTPHAGEWERLSGISSSNREQQEQAARSFAQKSSMNGFELVIVLKGARTFVTDGKEDYFNSTGNPSMAVGGSGDCLTGIITAMVCQGLRPLDAARCGVYLHGMAGDLAHRALGTPSSLAEELIHYLPEAFKCIGALNSDSAP